MQRTFAQEWLTYGKRIEAVLVGRRNCGMRSLELVLWGAENEELAREQFRVLLEQIVRRES